MEDFKLQFYVINDGVPNMPDSFILGMLDRAEKDGTLEVFFFGDQVVNREAFLYRVKTGQCLFAVGIKGDKIVGFGLLDDIHYKKANVHFCIFSEFWGGDDLVMMGKRTYEILLETFSVLCGIVPEENEYANRFVKKIELQKLGIIPKYFYNSKTEKFCDGVMYYITKGV